MDDLLPAATLRADPPDQIPGVSRVVTGLTFVLAMVPLYRYARVECLQGVAFACSLPSTEWAACFMTISTIERWHRLAVLLACRALVAEPEDLLGTSPLDLIRKAAVVCVVLVIPLCQQDSVLCNGWVCDPLCDPCTFSALRTASSAFADSSGDFGTPLVATDITVPNSRLVAVCHHAFRSTRICLVVPLSCHHRVLGSQGVVSAHFLSAALRTTIAAG